MENRRIKVLAIDDNFENLIIIQTAVLNAFPDGEVLLAKSGMEGFRLASLENPDVILLDIVMPEMDGFELCEKLKTDDTLSDIPVVFITAHMDDKESRIQGLEVGGEAFLSRPYDKNELITLIHAMLKRKFASDRRRDLNATLFSQIKEQKAELNSNYTATLNLM